MFNEALISELFENFKSVLLNDTLMSPDDCPK